ncbi:hypothetical protein CYMTET_33561 [Cymbomonas tetramitiformis]|uniref:Uncharacterized protein n=1 Tax=Cymbomonas tetramitiformis TaxID=36881 RepID=A0AAE0FCV7_9CHLO|nr:hypothetical protein CYMTET_33561 [Cymbomonas tetramitiformis]
MNRGGDTHLCGSMAISLVFEKRETSRTPLPPPPSPPPSSPPPNPLPSPRPLRPQVLAHHTPITSSTSIVPTAFTSAPDAAATTTTASASSTASPAAASVRNSNPNSAARPGYSSFCTVIPG